MKRYLCLVMMAYSAIAHGEEDAFAKWAATHAHPITTVEPGGGDDSDLLALKSAIGAAPVVALGEPMHGAHEPLAFRNRLFRFLVEQMGFTAIALESGFTESSAVGPFINGGEGDVESVAQQGLSIGTPPYSENHELIQWMRDYNAAAASAGHRRLRFYGVDLPAGARLSAPRRTIDSALTFLSRADPATAEKIRTSLGNSLPTLDDYRWAPLSPAALAALDTSVSAIAEAMKKSRKSLIARSSEEEYRWAVHNLDVARQLAKCLPLTPPAGADMNAWAPVMACRDSAMAENVQWAMKNEGRKGRLLVFAHNGHVMNSISDGRRWAQVREKPPMMGSHLRRVYGKNLYIIAMSVATNSGGLPAAKALEENSIDETLTGVGLPVMFLDVREAWQDEDVLTSLSSPLSLNANVSAQTLITPSTAVDAFLFVNTLTPAMLSADKAP